MFNKVSQSFMQSVFDKLCLRYADKKLKRLTCRLVEEGVIIL